MSTQTLLLSTQKTRSLSKDVAIVALSSLLIGLFAHVQIPLPFTPVPIALQPSLILFLALLLGSKRIAWTVMAFLTQGLCGLPVFAGGLAGLAHFAGPRGGYLVGYLVGAVLTAWIYERVREKRPSKAFLAMAVGNAAIFFFGAAYLSTFVGIKAALVLGVAPFILGDLLKLLIATKFANVAARGFSRAEDIA